MSEEKKKDRLKSLSLYPLTPEEAIKIALQAPPMPKGKKKPPKKTSSRATSSGRTSSTSESRDSWITRSRRGKGILELGRKQPLERRRHLDPFPSTTP